jgi:serine/threonine protein kinase
LEFPAGGHVMPPQGASAMAENDVKRRIMGPVLDALAALHEMSIVHRGVHPHNLFYADEQRRQVVLGDGVSCVPGQCQPSAFEPLERASVAPLGRGRGGREADVHAFGATILALLMGRLPGADIPTEDLVDGGMERGSLRALMGDFRCSRNMERLLDGMMSDSPEDRWSLDDVAQ